MDKNNFFGRPALLFVLFLVFSPLARAYADADPSSSQFATQRRFIEEEYINKLRVTEKAALLKEGQKIKFDGGGLFSLSYVYYKDLDNDSDEKDTLSSLLAEEVWLWGKASFSNGDMAYVRIRDSYTQKQNSFLYSGVATGYDHNGPALDMAYYYTRIKNHSVILGRQYFLIGKGIAFRDINDGLQVLHYSLNWAYKFIFAHTLPHQNNVDTSIPGYDKDSNSRYFFGAELGYVAKEDQKIYAYFLLQKDASNPHPADPEQNYRYDSEYFGLGFSSFKNNWDFRGEVIKEYGRSHTDSKMGPVRRIPIDAWAAILGARYSFKNPAKAESDFEIAYGSGDGNRTGVTRTKNSGNSGSKDYGFLYFGNYMAGYALSPELSNLYVLKFDQSIKPLYFTRLLKELTVGAKFIGYLKDKAKGGISDSDASVHKRFVGTELNFYSYWPITKEINFVFRYGIFFPGNAYPKNTRESTKYLYTRITYIF